MSLSRPGSGSSLAARAFDRSPIRLPGAAVLECRGEVDLWNREFTLAIEAMDRWRIVARFTVSSARGSFGPSNVYAATDGDAWPFGVAIQRKCSDFRVSRAMDLLMRLLGRREGSRVGGRSR